MTHQPKSRLIRRAVLLAAIIALPAGGAALVHRSAPAAHSPGSRRQTDTQEGVARWGHMQDKDRKERNRKPRPTGESPEIGAVRVFSNPGPDAPDRLRRLLSLMVRYAARDGTTAPDQASPGENHGQAEER